MSVIERIFCHKSHTANPVGRVPFIRLPVVVGILVLAGLIVNISVGTSESIDSLEAIGNGKPVVVLVNAGECIGCGEVTERVTSALAGLDDLQFRVVDVCSRAWQPFSQAYHAEPLSVLLFDADGLNTETVKGLQSEAAYHALFQRWFDEECERQKHSA